MSWTLVPRNDVTIGRRLLQIWGNAVPLTPSDGQVFIVPLAAGSITVEFALTVAKFRLETPGTTTDTVVEVQASPGGGAPTWLTIATLTLGIGEYETSEDISAYTVDSGDLFRIVWTDIDPVAASPLIHVEGEA